MNPVLRNLTLIGCFAPPALYAAVIAPSAEHFAGAIELPGMKLEFDVDLRQDEKGVWSGDISIPAQEAKDLPLTAVEVTAENISFRIDGVPGDPTFEGKRTASGRVEGEFSQNGGTFSFTMDEKGRGADAAKTALANFAEELERARAAVEAPGAAMVIVKDDEIVFLGAVGKRDVEKDLPATTKTLFAIGSSTKAFTAFVLGTLVDEGLLSFDEPVRKWLPKFQLHDPMASERITPRDLLTHRSGLPRHDLVWYLQPDLSRSELVERLAFLEPSKDLRTTWQYNNLMFVTAGYLEEKVAGQAWEDLVRERILSPLGMRRTNFSVEESQRDPDHAQPYLRIAGATKQVPFHSLDNVGPAGSINSSVEEMAQWVRLHLSDGTLDGKKLISSSTLAEMHTPHMLMAESNFGAETRAVGYGLGWFVDEFRGVRRFHHGGHIDGFSSLVTFVPAEKIGMAILVNQNGSALNELAVQLALDRLLVDRAAPAAKQDRIGAIRQAMAVAETTEKATKQKKVSARKTGTSPSHPLADFCGEYSHPGYGSAKITLEDGALALGFGNSKMPLKHAHYDVFESAEDDQFGIIEVLFTTNFAGDVDAMKWSVEPTVAPAVFTRRPASELLDPAYLARFEGEYDIEGQQLATVTLSGHTLRCTVPGQPTYELLPTHDDTFELSGLAGYRVRFLSEKDGKVTGAEFMQPDGTHMAARK